jgi:hypothetical protein
MSTILLLLALLFGSVPTSNSGHGTIQPMDVEQETDTGG